MYIPLSLLPLSLLLGLQSVAALPAANGVRGGKQQMAQILRGTGIRGMTVNQLNTLLRNLQAQGVTLGCGAQGGGGQGAVGGGEGATGGEEEAKENELVLNGKFDVPVAVQGGELKQDILFTSTAVGAFEYEYQAANADEVTVSENKSPAAPPAGFEAIEPSSFKITLAQSKGAGLTLSKIDYIFDPASAGLQGKDITKSQVGKLCENTGQFVISDTLGSLEFELEENEVTLNLDKNVTAEGEWGIFLPIAA
ncbi:uncharacterized protein EI97DRAFT_461930 [Westerdykella ornata]|uniref:Uncharacterized protein n=1 Tax=Westerdykella ornata TaxID=318751 RepID=A0A6A6J7N2_WESOR|nr:uncharacterized protein EI97DRAFT_461930 [Westerdykella ornata]KAF2272412.1 hypothetical protein EI97DRAFT_461930 [Westerdykella ornata]